jgi:hypothetical protein
MTIETKRDVFDEVRYKFRNFKNEHRHGMYASPDSIDHYLNNALKRYAAALPDNLPVIPESVSGLLVAQKQYYRPLSNVLGPVHELGVMRQQSSNPSLNWVANHENEFARAWVLEVWKVKETEEVVRYDAKN